MKDDFNLSVDHVFLLWRDPVKTVKAGKVRRICKVYFINAHFLHRTGAGLRREERGQRRGGEEGGGKREEEEKFSISKVTHWQPSTKIILQFSHLASISFLLRYN